MPEKEPSQLSCDDLISRLARVARAVVYYDKSYDIVDELYRMADDQDKVLRLLSELSRVVLKVFDDVRDYVDLQGNSNEERVKKVRKLYKAMQKWSKILEEFERNCLQDPKNVRKLASLSLVPDGYALALSEALGK